MQFSPKFLDEIRNRLTISDIIGRKVRLKSKGHGEFLGLCPFHNEKTPSFTVSDEKGFYHCFGCGVHGDVIKFIMEQEGKNFPETVEDLAREAGMEIPKADKRDEERYRKLLDLYDVTEIASKWFETQLWSHNSGSKEALNYLRDRGLTDITIRNFRLGFAPDGRSFLKDAMIKQGCTEQQLINAGLIIKSEDQTFSYDRFRNRVLFPIMDIKSRVIAFGGRIMGDGQPKYLNSPETELFHKGGTLYAMNFARQRAYDKNAIAVVEGYMDVIALHQAGITNVVAPLGTALTADQLRILWKITKEPVICLDGDIAGRRAMARAAENCLPLLEPGLSLNFAILPDKQDPDDIVRNEGVSGIRKILASTMPLSEALWNMALGGRNTTTPEQKASFEQDLMGLVETIKNTTVKEHYRKYFRNRLWESSNPRLAAKNLQRKLIAPETRKISRFENQGRSQLERQIMLIIVNNPQLLEDTGFEAELHKLEFTDQKMEKIRSEIYNFIHRDVKIDYEALLQHLEKAGLNTYIQELNTDKFLDKFAKNCSNFNIIMAIWRYTIHKYNLLQMEDEYNKAVTTMSDETFEIVFELKKQKDMLKILVEKEKISYEAALED